MACPLAHYLVEYSAFLMGTMNEYPTGHRLDSYLEFVKALLMGNCLDFLTGASMVNYWVPHLMQLLENYLVRSMVW